MEETLPHFWTFSANPGIYRIEKAVQDRIIDYWTVPHRNVHKGDRAIIWKTKGNSQQRGIIALAEVLTDPVPCKDPNREYWIDRNAPDEIIDRVRVHYHVPHSFPLWLDESSPNSLRELNVARATGGSVFHVSPEQWNAILLLVGGWPAPEIEDTELALAELAGQSERGQGFRADVAVRKAIEQHAMREAKAYFEKQGWNVTDVSARYPYDLLCISETGEELRVEVKGTISDGTQILLTAKEVKHARDYYPNVALFILAQIQVDQTSSGQPQVNGGNIQLLHPWNIDEGTLSPLAFAYTLHK